MTADDATTAARTSTPSCCGARFRGVSASSKRRARRGGEQIRRRQLWTSPASERGAALSRGRPEDVCGRMQVRRASRPRGACARAPAVRGAGAGLAPACRGPWWRGSTRRRPTIRGAGRALPPRVEARAHGPAALAIRLDPTSPGSRSRAAGARGRARHARVRPVRRRVDPDGPSTASRTEPAARAPPRRAVLRAAVPSDRWTILTPAASVTRTGWGSSAAAPRRPRPPRTRRMRFLAYYASVYNPARTTGCCAAPPPRHARQLRKARSSCRRAGRRGVVFRPGPRRRRRRRSSPSAPRSRLDAAARGAAPALSGRPPRRCPARARRAPICSSWANSPATKKTSPATFVGPRGACSTRPRRGRARARARLRHERGEALRSSRAAEAPPAAERGGGRRVQGLALRALALVKPRPCASARRRRRPSRGPAASSAIAGNPRARRGRRRMRRITRGALRAEGPARAPEAAVRADSARPEELGRVAG